jgi:hypothetical protein
MRIKQLQYEQDQVEKLEDLAAEIADQCPWLWTWGDGHGGYVLEEIRKAFDNAGLIRRYVTTKSRNRRKPMSARKSLAVFAADGYACVTCGSREDLCVDHIYPVSKGGSNEMSNLQTLCRSCNSRKGAKVVDQSDAGAGAGG